jgi:hypothetical protein
LVVSVSIQKVRFSKKHSIFGQWKNQPPNLGH